MLTTLMGNIYKRCYIVTQPTPEIYGYRMVRVDQWWYGSQLFPSCCRDLCFYFSTPGGSLRPERKLENIIQPTPGYKLHAISITLVWGKTAMTQHYWEINRTCTICMVHIDKNIHITIRPPYVLFYHFFLTFLRQSQQNLHPHISLHFFTNHRGFA